VGVWTLGGRVWYARDVGKQAEALHRQFPYALSPTKDPVHGLRFPVQNVIEPAPPFFPGGVIARAMGLFRNFWVSRIFSGMIDCVFSNFLYYVSQVREDWLSSTRWRFRSSQLRSCLHQRKACFKFIKFFSGSRLQKIEIVWALINTSNSTFFGITTAIMTAILIFLFVLRYYSKKAK